MDTAGFGLRDEVKSLSEAAGLPSWMGGFRAPVGAVRLSEEKNRGRIGFGGTVFGGQDRESPGGLTGLVTGDRRGPIERTYETARDETRRLQKAAQEQHPSAFLAGQLGGGVIGSLVLPGGALEEGAGTLARAGRAAKTGAIYGGAYGFGSGEGGQDSLIQGVVGAGVGGAAGGVLSPAVDAAQWASGQAARAGGSIYQAIRAGLNPEFVSDEASRRILRSVNTDVAARGFPWSAEDQGVAAKAGIDRATVDTGGERTMALARSAANQSPEARAALSEFSNERFFGQTRRAANFIKDLTGGADAAGDIEAIRERARIVNRPAYERAYKAGDRPIWSPELERLTGAPAIQQAMKSAAVSGQDRAIEEGFGAFNPGVTVTPDGRVLMGQTMRGGAVRGTPTYPNIQYWDYVHRDLRDMAEKVAGREPDKARYLNGLHQQLASELDRMVPQFQNARVGAWRAFQSEDAVEAGKKFVSARGENSEYGRDIAKMSGPDRELFARGYASELSDRALELRDNQNLLNQAFLTSPAAKERHAMALGPDRAKQLETYLRAESLADRLRTALGNSTTAGSSTRPR